jgi:predicted ribosome quality control (RQC) complex YloA/Tae2 family protein
MQVGKQATDNDVLSTSPEHRSGSHWWYHASGCSGSHVVLCTDAASPSEEDILDAASLAAFKSKCIGQSVIKVSMTRARNVSKPPGAKAGLVQLSGDIRTITIRKGEVEKRCKRLEETVVVN